MLGAARVRTCWCAEVAQCERSHAMATPRSRICTLDAGVIIEFWALHG